MQENTVQTLIDYTKDLTGLDSIPTAKVIRALNFGADHYSYLALTSSGVWKWDSRSHTNLPRITATLSTSGIIELSSETITVEHFEALIDGKYQTVDPISQRDSSTPLDTEYGSSGKPQVYSLTGRFLRVYPTPDQAYTVRMTQGRAHQRFSTSELDAAVGVEPIQEEYIALYAADRLMIGSSDTARVAIREELAVKEKEVRDLFSRRDQDRPRRLKATIPNVFKRR